MEGGGDEGFSEGRAEVAAAAERAKAVGGVEALRRALEVAAGGGEGARTYISRRRR